MVQPEHVKEDLIPMFHNLANDEQVRNIPLSNHFTNCRLQTFHANVSRFDG